jgi:hypothetical protein
MALVVSCDSVSFSVDPSGYQDLDDLSVCINNYLDPAAEEEFCSAEDLTIELENYVLFFANQFDYIEGSLNILVSSGGNDLLRSSSSSDLFYMNININVDTTFSNQFYNTLELIYLQILQEMGEATNYFTGVSLNINFTDVSNLFFRGTINGSRSENTLSRTIKAIDLSKTTVNLYTDYIETYIGEDYDYTFDTTVIDLTSMDSNYYLDVNHEEKDYVYHSFDAQYSSADFELLTASLLPGYDLLVEEEDIYLKN